MTAGSRRDVGVVGLGSIGHFHADRIRDLGASLVGGVDVVPDARERFADRFDAPTWDRAPPLFDRADVVVVTTPNAFHEEYAVAALERGLDVLVEKPLAHSLSSARRIAVATEESSGRCVVGFNYRFANTVRILRERVRRGDLGDVTHVEANYVRRRGVPGRGTWFTSSEVAGGGALVDLGVHAIDLALYLLEFPPLREVSGTTRAEFGSREEYAYLEMWGADDGPDDFDVEDSASAFVRCGGDRTISMEVAWATNRPATHEFVVHGTEAAARFDLLEDRLSLHSASRAGDDHLTDTTVTSREVDTHRAELDAFLGATGDDATASIDEGLTTQRVVDAVYRSSERGAAVTLDTVDAGGDTS